MKKLLTVLLAAVMAAACCFGLTACGDSTFNGNYKEVSAEEQQAFVQAASEAEQNTISLVNGADLSVTAKGTMEGVKVDVSLSLKAAAVGEGDDADFQAEGSVKAKVEQPATSADAGEDASGFMLGNVNADLKVYYTQGYGYANGTVQIGDTEEGKTTLKNKTAIDLSDLSDILGMASSVSEDVGQYAGLLQGGLLDSVMNMSAWMQLDQSGNNSINVLFDLDNKKVKADIAITDEGATVNGTLYLVFDENYNLIAIKADINIANAESKEELTVNVTFKGYNGKINLPAASELETYEEAELPSYGFGDDYGYEDLGDGEIINEDI